MTSRNHTVSPDCSKSSVSGRGEVDQEAAEITADERQVQALDVEDDASSMASDDVAEWLEELDREEQLTDVEEEAQEQGAGEQPSAGQSAGPPEAPPPPHGRTCATGGSGFMPHAPSSPRVVTR